MIEYRDNYIVLTAWGEKAGGSGWVNPIVWVLLQKKGTNDLRLECLQDHEQSSATRALLGASAAMSDSMTKCAAQDLRALMTEVRKHRGDK